MNEHLHHALVQQEKEAKLKDGQDAGKALLAIEARIGELALKEDRQALKGTDGRFKDSGKPLKYERLGMKQKQMRNAQAIFSHRAEVEEVKAEIYSRDIGEI